MSLVWSEPRLGNLRCYDVRNRVNLTHFAPDFHRLHADPYVREGYRRKHVARYRVKKLKGPGYGYENVERGGVATLYQPPEVNPTHGGIERVYPRFEPMMPCALGNTLALFAELGEVPDGQEVLFQAQRITCTPDGDGLPSVEGWHADGVRTIGIICLARHNVDGGINQFRPVDREDDVISLRLPPGHMAIFEDAEVMHRVTPISSSDGVHDGFRDVILLAFPSLNRA